MFSKILISFFIILFLSSCAINSDHTVPLPKIYQSHTKKVIKKKQKLSKTGFIYNTKILQANQNIKILKFKGNGFIKGIIKYVYYSNRKKSWIYDILGTDLSNHKLKTALVYGEKDYARKGELVYAVIKDGKITSIFILNSTKNYKIIKNKNNKISKKFKYSHKHIIKLKKKPYSRARKEVISVPTEENITF